MPGIEEGGEHAPEIEIHETGARIEQKIPVPDHLFKGHEPHGQVRQQLLLLLKPLVETAPAKFPFLKAQILELLGSGNEFLVISIVQFEGEAFDVILDVTPNDFLNPIPLRREQP